MYLCKDQEIAKKYFFTWENFEGQNVHQHPVTGSQGNEIQKQ